MWFKIPYIDMLDLLFTVMYIYIWMLVGGQNLCNSMNISRNLDKHSIREVHSNCFIFNLLALILNCSFILEKCYF